MNTRVYDMDSNELMSFVQDLKYDDLLELNGTEIRTIKNFKPGLVDSLVNNEPFPDLEESIFYKELFSVKLTEVEKEYLNEPQ